MAREFQGKIELDVRDSVPDWDAFRPPTPPSGAPNVLVVLYDDTGMAALCGEGLTIGRDSADPVSSLYGYGFDFTGGEIAKVVFDIADDAYLDLEAHLAAAMARD